MNMKLSLALGGEVLLLTTGCVIANAVPQLCAQIAMSSFIYDLPFRWRHLGLKVSNLKLDPRSNGRVEVLRRFPGPDRSLGEFASPTAAQVAC